MDKIIVPFVLGTIVGATLYHYLRAWWTTRTPRRFRRLKDTPPVSELDEIIHDDWFEPKKGKR